MDMLIDSDDSTSPLSSPLPPSSPLSSPLSSQTSLRSSPEPCLVQTSSPTPSSSSSPRSSSPRIKKRRERREKQSEVTVYSLRPRDRKPALKRDSSSSLTLIEDTSSSHSNPSSSLETDGISTSQGYRPGRLQKWQLAILQKAFDSGIWSPGDATVEVLTGSLKNRTDKQIRDWFSHRRRKLREAGISDKRSGPEEDVVEALFLLRQGDRTQGMES